MGGDVSHEFMVPAESGEDKVLYCKNCKYVEAFRQESIQLSCPKCAHNLDKINTLEVGHIFKLRTKYSLSLGAQFLDKDGIQKPLIMGCYGIGVSRIIPAIIEQNHDAEGIIWPKEISPYKVIIIPLNIYERKVMEIAKYIYESLINLGIDVILDDRDEQAGVKFKDADLIGIYLKVVIGKEFLSKGNLELSLRKDKKIIKVKKEAILNRIKKLLYE
jgi:prolyl-tRNA synthetase